jgi:U6 snRNA-associated Sm-like protein LSm3
VFKDRERSTAEELRSSQYAGGSLLRWKRAMSFTVGKGQLEEPVELLRIALDERVFVKLKGDRELVGTLHAYDQHLNLIISDAEETLQKAELDEETYEQIVRQERRKLQLVYVRGDTVFLVSPLLRHTGTFL